MVPWCVYEAGFGYSVLVGGHYAGTTAGNERAGPGRPRTADQIGGRIPPKSWSQLGLSQLAIVHMWQISLDIEPDIDYK